MLGLLKRSNVIKSVHPRQYRRPFFAGSCLLQTVASSVQSLPTKHSTGKYSLHSMQNRALRGDTTSAIIISDAISSVPVRDVLDPLHML